MSRKIATVHKMFDSMFALCGVVCGALLVMSRVMIGPQRTCLVRRNDSSIVRYKL